MTIFRCRWILMAALCVAGCDGASDVRNATTPPKSAEAKPANRIKIERAGKVIDAAELLRAHKANPNRLAVDNAGKSFVVSAKIARVPEFHQGLDLVSGYYLPLIVSDLSGDAALSERIRSRARKLPEVGSVSLFVKGFSQERAAKLDQGQLITAKCPKLRVVDDGLVFDDCLLEMT